MILAGHRSEHCATIVRVEQCRTKKAVEGFDREGQRRRKRKAREEERD